MILIALAAAAQVPLPESCSKPKTHCFLGNTAASPVFDDLRATEKFEMWEVQCVGSAKSDVCRMENPCAYTAKEIEDMRIVVERKYMSGQYGPVFSSHIDAVSFSTDALNSYIAAMVPLFVRQCLKADDLIAEENAQ